MAIFLCAGLAPDVDWFFHLPAPLSPLRAYGAATHSFVGAGVLAGVIGAGGWAAARKLGREKPSLGIALGSAIAGTGAHLLLDACSNAGIAFYWPFRAARVAWNLAGGFDGLLVALLTVCILLPALFSLITEEIGAGGEAQPSRAWPFAALLLAAIYLGGRAMLHSRAEEILGAAQYQGSAPRHWAAYPLGTVPLTWRGVVETETFLGEMEVRVAGGPPFDPRRASLRFKPESSAALDVAAASPLARAYTAQARFPSASIEQTAEGVRAELRELGDSPLRSSGGVWLAVIELDAQSHVLRQDLHFLPSRTP
jgi:membrane-bound metal-dependent hydrolase YbcI (DUF457 family)